MLLLSVLAVPWLFGCARSSETQVTSETAATAIPLGAEPSAVVSFCRDRARREAFLVLCPTRYPGAARSGVTDTGHSLLGPSFYWASFNDQSGVGDGGHLILGAQRPALSLGGSPGERWPRPGERAPVRQLQLPRAFFVSGEGGVRYVAQRPPRVLQRTTVEGRPALVLVAAPYPVGGFHGDHLIVIWNRAGHGYFLSLHFQGAPNGRSYTQAERLTAAVATAASFAPVSP